MTRAVLVAVARADLILSTLAYVLKFAARYLIVRACVKSIVNRLWR